MEQKQFLQQKMLEQLDMHLQKLKSRHRSHTFAKINSEMDHRYKCKMKNYKTFKGKNPLDSSARQTVLRLNTNSMTHKRKNG